MLSQLMQQMNKRGVQPVGVSPNSYSMPQDSQLMNEINQLK